MRKAGIVSGVVLCVALALAVIVSDRGSSAQGLGPELIIYTGENFTGHYFTVTDTLLDMPPGSPEGAAEPWGWNDSVKSLVVVRGTWRLCQHGRLNTKIDDVPIESLTVEAAKAKGCAGGWSCLVSANSLGPVQHALPTNGIWGSDISSIELLSEENLPDWASVTPR